MPDAPADRPFQMNGVNHLALVCRDMARTVDFYTNVLGMPLIKTIELPAGMGQHFFFDCGGGDSLAFFWFPDAPEPAPGVSAPAVASRPGRAHQRDRVDEPRRLRRARRQDRAVPRPPASRPASTAPRWPTTTTASGASAKEMHPGVFVRSVYFQDPDGILLEFACWTKTFGPDDVAVEPARRRHAGRRLTAGHAPTPAGSEGRGHRAHRHAHVRLPVRGTRPRRRARHRHRLAGGLVDGVRPRARRARPRRRRLRPLRQPEPRARPDAARAGPDPRRVGGRQPVRLLAALQVPAQAWA